MIEILKSEFIWGIVIGLVLSVLGSWLLAKFTVSMTTSHQKKVVMLFCIDAITNLQNIVKEMDGTRDRTQAIHHDFLALIDVEIGVYGRNREHLIHLTQTLRTEVRKFMNDCAIKRAEVVLKLDQFYRAEAHADQIHAAGRGPEAQRIRQNALSDLAAAHKAADRLVSIAKDANALVSSLSKL